MTVLPTPARPERVGAGVSISASAGSPGHPAVEGARFAGVAPHVPSTNTEGSDLTPDPPGTPFRIGRIRVFDPAITG